MRRVILLTLLALALPTTALANDIDFNSGSFKSGSITSSFGNPFHVRVVGSMDSITFSSSTISCSSATTCTFRSGTVTVVNPAGVTVFTDGTKNGEISIGTGTIRTASIEAYLQPNSMGTGGFTTFNFKFTGDNILAGNANVEPVPETGALEGLLLGFGVIGLAGMTRRKLKLGT